MHLKQHDLRSLICYTSAYALVAVVTLHSLCRAQEFVVEGKRVAEIRIVGNKEIPTDSIQGVLTLEVGSEVTAEKIDADKERINQMGFFTDVQVKSEATQRGTIITFTVFENPKVESINIEGNDSVPTDELIGLMKTKPGTVLNSNVVQKDMDAIRDYYRKQGYIAEVEDVDIKPGGVLKALIHEAVIEAITFPKKKGAKTDRYGLFKTREKIVRREMTVKPGDKFNSKKLARDINAIFNLGLFDDLRFEPKQGSTPGDVIVEIIAKEKKTGTAAVGLGFSSRSEIIGFVDLTEANFKGLGESLAFRGEAGDRRSYELSFANPWFDQKHTSLSTGIYDRLIFRQPRGGFSVPNPAAVSTSTFEERRKGGRIGLSRPVKKDTRTRVGIQIRDEEVSLVQTDTTTSASFKQDFGRVVGIALTASRDTRDVIFDPTSGGRAAATLEFAGALLGGTNSFTKLDIDLRRYKQVLKKYVIAGRALLGASLTGSFPPFEQYFIGGSDTLRGYDIDHNYGDALVLLNLELRRKIQKNIQGVLFIDYGDAWAGPNSTGSSFQGNVGYGLGARIQTPVGPIRLDYGIGSEGSRLHFSIGQAF